MASTMVFAGEQVVAGSSPHEPGFLQAETICFHPNRPRHVRYDANEEPGSGSVLRFFWK